jgi:HD-GYP domain-containing protein (c-di-GMP phosphodiesterase class II)
MPSNCPSYLPADSPNIPPNLIAELKHWDIEPRRVLEPFSADALINGIRIMDGMFRGNFLKKRGLDKTLPGTNSLRGHSTRACIISLLTNDELIRSDSAFAVDPEILALAAIGHDIGKLRKDIHDIFFVDEEIPRTDKDRWNLIEQHPEEGYKAMMAYSGVPFQKRRRVAEAIRYHHERMNGRGYYGQLPFNVPRESWIIAPADTIDAMSDKKRPHGNHPDLKGILEEIRRCTPDQFHPEVAKAIQALPHSEYKELISFFPQAA